MEGFPISIILFLLLTLRGFDTAEYENGGYIALISLDPGLEQNKGKELIESIKNLSAVASSKLFQITRKRAFFKELKILVPVGWNVTIEENDGLSLKETYQSSDIRISNGAFNPNTIQPRGCGQEGEYIKISQDYLLSKDITEDEKAFALVREWLKFRFGIFNENGFNQSFSFPEVYWGNDGLNVTGCTTNNIWDEEKLNKTWKFKEGHFTDYILEKKDNTSKVPFSIMDNKIKDQAEGVCSDEQHNFFAPTQHNALCEEASVWSIINRKNELTPYETDLGDTKITLIREKHIHPVFILDKELKSNQMLIETVANFLENVFPDEEKLGTLFIKSRQKPTEPLFGKKQDIQELKEDVINEIIRSDLSMEEQVAFAKKILNDNNGFLVIISNSNIRESYIVTLRRLASSVHWISIGTTERTNYKNVDFYNIPENKQDPCNFKLRLELNSLLITIYREFTSASQNKLTEITRVLHKERTSPLQETVQIDNMDYTHVRLFFHFCDASISSDVYNRKLLVFEDNVAANFKNSPVLASRIYWTVKSITYNLKFNYPVAVSGIREDKNASVPLITSKIYHEALSEEDFAPQVFYGTVFSQDEPVTDAEVIAVITGPNSSTIYIPLKDNGFGDPDISLNDGVYSAYFTEFNLEKGWYSNSLKISYSKWDNNVLHHYEQFVSGKSFFSSERNDPENFYPPNRITDVQIQTMDTSSAEVTLGWTAPGSNLGSRTIVDPNEALDIRCSQDFDKIRSFSEEGTEKINCSTESLKETKPGDKQLCSFHVEDPTLIYYCAIVAKNNRRDKTNRRSNIIIVHFPPGYRPLDTNVTVNVILSTGEIVGIVLGSIVFLVIVLMIIFCCCCRRRKSPKDNHPPNQVEIIPRYPEPDYINYKNNDQESERGSDYYAQNFEKVDQFSTFHPNGNHRNGNQIDYIDESYPRGERYPYEGSRNLAYQTEEPRRDSFPDCDRSVVDYEVIPPKQVIPGKTLGTSNPSINTSVPTMYRSNENYITPPSTPFVGNTNPAFQDEGDNFYDIPNGDEIAAEPPQQLYSNDPAPTYAQPNKSINNQTPSTTHPDNQYPNTEEPYRPDSRQYPSIVHAEPYSQYPPEENEFPDPPYPQPYTQPSKADSNPNIVEVGPNPQPGKTYRPILEIHDASDYPRSYPSTSTEV